MSRRSVTRLRRAPRAPERVQHTTARGRVTEEIAAATRQLTAAGVPSPRRDAEALAAHLLGVPRSALLTVGQLDAGAYADLVSRRSGREPLQHLIGHAYFRHLDLLVGPGVFLPRPETELLVELVLPRVALGTVAVDLCAGSGAVALALATERPGLVVHAVESEPAATNWLRRNVEGIAPQVRVHQQSARTFASRWDGRADVVAANPPYLPSGTDVDREVAEHDPPPALWAGADGLAVLREVAGAAARVLRPGGMLAVEHDASHQGAVVGLLRDNGFGEVRGHPDLTGRDRFATGVRR